jgi:ZIP family zinc transporter
VLALGTVMSTLAGGAFALRASARLRLVLAFTTGVVLGVVCFDVLPEIFDLATSHRVDVARPMSMLVLGFLLFRSVDALMVSRSRQRSVGARAEELFVGRHPHAGIVAGLALAGHSAFDGVSIGVAFQVSPAIGTTVAMAVLAHDFADGINTVGIVLAHGNSPRRARIMLALDAAAPLAGAASTLLVRFPPNALVLYLGFFAGFLLHVATMGAAGAMPQTPSMSPVRGAVPVVALAWIGAAFAYIVARGTR